MGRVRRWTREEGLVALRTLAARLGRTPRSREMGGGECPSTQFFLKYFGSISAAQRAAGLWPTNKGRKAYRPPGADWRIHIVPIDPEKADAVTRAKRAYWENISRGKHGLSGWTHPYARRAG
jgi:hypothetical protein